LWCDVEPDEQWDEHRGEHRPLGKQPRDDDVQQRDHQDEADEEPDAPMSARSSRSAIATDATVGMFE
jgi:hypothetical protein